jgi:hypothetical protein
VDRDETTLLLRARSGLTSQPYSDDVTAAWCEALRPWTYTQARAALVDAAREEKRITVAHLVDRLPRTSHTPRHREHCELCDGTGWTFAPQAHHPATCNADPCLCEAVVRCRCTTWRR